MTGQRTRTTRGAAAWLVTGLLPLVAACGGASQPAAPAGAPSAAAAQPDESVGTVTDAMLQDGHRGRPATWPTVRRRLGQSRYSPLTEIRRDNVAQLRPAWIAQTGVVGSFENTPIVLGREMLRRDAGRRRRAARHPAGSTDGSDLAGRPSPATAPVNRPPPKTCTCPRTSVEPGRGRYDDKVYVGTLNGRLQGDRAR